MGLDCYLNKKINLEFESIVVKSRTPIENSDKQYNDVVQIVINVGYWRSWDFIHNYFVNAVKDGISDCNQSKEFEFDVLDKLREICKEGVINPKKLKEYYANISTQEVFVEMLNDTIDIINDLERTYGNNSDGYVYEASY